MRKKLGSRQRRAGARQRDACTCPPHCTVVLTGDGPLNDVPTLRIDCGHETAAYRGKVPHDLGQPPSQSSVSGGASLITVPEDRLTLCFNSLIQCAPADHVNESDDASSSQLIRVCVCTRAWLREVLEGLKVLEGFRGLVVARRTLVTAARHHPTRRDRQPSQSDAHTKRRSQHELV
jgi:hypothetical protein